MAEKRNPLKGQNLENILGILGQTLDVGGKFVFGPNAGIDFGAPVKLASGMLREKREAKNLQETLAELSGELPEIAPILQGAQNVTSQGGLVNMLGQMGGQPAGTGAPQASSIADAGQVGQTGVPSTESTVAPSSQTITTSPTAPRAPVDLSSDAALLKLIQGAPQLAEPLLKSRVGGAGRADPIAETLKALRLQSFETPEQKRQKDLEVRTQLQDQSTKNIERRQETQRKEQTRLQAEKLTNAEQKRLGEVDNLLAGLNTIEQDIASGTSSDLVLGAISRRLGPTGERLVQAINPDKALSFKNQTEQAALFQKVISGVAVSEPEARRLAPTRPQPTDSPEVQKKLVLNLRKKTNEAKLIHIANVQQRMEQSGGTYKGPLAREAKLYRLIRDKMNSNFSGSLKNVDIQAIRRELGIDYGVFNRKK